MNSKYLLKASGWIAGLFLLLCFTACSDDESNDLANYKLIVSDASGSYYSNSEMESQVNEILAHFATSNQESAIDAGLRWQNACDSLLRYDWAGNDYYVAYNTWNVITLSSNNGSGNESTIINSRRLEFPYVVYNLYTSNHSSAFEMNIPVQNEVSNILASFYEPDSTCISMRRSDARQLFQEVCDSLNKHNWRRNDLAVRKGTSFTLQLKGRTKSAQAYWPIYAEQTIRLDQD